MSTRSPEKFPTPSEKISTRHLKKFPTPSEKYHLYPKRLNPPEIILTPLKFLNPYPRKFLNPPENFSTTPRKFLNPPPRKFLNSPPPENFSTPHESFSTPPPENFSTSTKISQSPLKISQPHSKKYQPQNMLREVSLPQHHFFFFLSLFLHFSKKNLKILVIKYALCQIMGGGGDTSPIQP